VESVPGLDHANRKIFWVRKDLAEIDAVLAVYQIGLLGVSGEVE
jgi:hypothetical protein